jgi:hypothetical protein
VGSSGRRTTASESPLSRPSLIEIIRIRRSAIFMSHVPWLGMLFLRFPKLAKDLKAFRAHAQKSAITRKKRGSPNKDLFHYLVTRPPILLDKH